MGIRKRELKFEALCQRNMLAGDVCFPSVEPDECGEPTWHNVNLPTDVDNSGKTTALDALLIINEVDRGTYTDSQNGFELVDPATVDPHPNLYYDVNNDGKGSTLDALLVINQLARERNSLEGELPITNGTGQQIIPISYLHDEVVKEEQWLYYQNP